MDCTDELMVLWYSFGLLDGVDSPGILEDCDPGAILQSCCNRLTDGPPRRPCSINGGPLVALLRLDFRIALGLLLDSRLRWTVWRAVLRLDCMGVHGLYWDFGIA